MAASEYALKQFGFRTTVVVNPLVSSVGTSVVKVLSQNPDRIEWLIMNLSANTVYLAYGPDVSSSKGMVLAANGGSAVSKVTEDGEAVAYEVWAIASGLSSSIYVVEYVRS